jgi:hypothetical protein
MPVYAGPVSGSRPSGSGNLYRSRKLSPAYFISGESR